jgi:hypothetical protein
MESSGSKKEKEESNFTNNNFSIRKEEKVKEGDNLTLKNSKILFEKAEKSICKIIKDRGYGDYNIINRDETPLYFNIEPNKTIVLKFTKNV